MATAKKLPSGNWRVQAYKNGQIKSFTGSSRRLVEAEAAAWQAGQKNDTCENITVGKAYEKYFEIKQNVLSPSTLRNYKKMYRTHFQDIMRVPLGRLTAEQVQRAVNELAAIRSPKTVRNNYGLLTAVLDMYRPSFNPNASLPKKVKKEIYVPTKNDIKKLLEITKDTNYYIPVLLAATCGMREGEICALTSKDVNGNKINVNKSMVCDEYGEWRLKQPKSYAGYRIVEAPTVVEKALKGICGKLVKYNPHSLSVGFHKLLLKNNMPLFSFHALRHFYVSELFDMGLPEKYIIAQVGHSTSNITRSVYDHLSAEKQTKYAVDVAEHFSKFSS